jgi:acetate kinase
MNHFIEIRKLSEQIQEHDIELAESYIDFIENAIEHEKEISRVLRRILPKMKEVDQSEIKDIGNRIIEDRKEYFNK